MPNKIERREFVKRAAYAAPVILTLKAMPAFAAAGSSKHKASGRGETQGNGVQTGPGSERSQRDSAEKGESGRRHRP
jgi:hypothetical protein